MVDKVKKVFQDFAKAVLSGFMIGIGGTVYLNCSNKIVGAFLFTIGLITICEFGFNLYTGKVGYTLINGQKWADKLKFLGIVILGNYVGTMIYGLAYGAARPELRETAGELCTKKLEQNPLTVFLLAICCGILMFIAVDAYRKNAGNVAKYVAILIGIPTFILSGFEHSIADMVYFAFAPLSVNFQLKTFGFLLVVLIGNGLGGVLIPWCQKYLYPETGKGA